MYLTRNMNNELEQTNELQETLSTHDADTRAHRCKQIIHNAVSWWLDVTDTDISNDDTPDQFWGQLGRWGL